MSGIFSGIQSIIDIILAPIRFLLSIVQWTNYMLKVVGQVATNIVTLIGTLPSWLTAYATIGISIMVIYLIIGRSTGK